MKLNDALLNKISMYRLVVYGLAVLAVAGILMASLGRISLSPIWLTVSLLLLLTICFLTDLTFSKLWHAPFNHESWLITALIIFLILQPPKNTVEAIVTLTAGLIASASKYILVWRNKHIFNPAALAVAFMSLSGLQLTSWWIGSSSIWLLTLLIGLIIVRKIRKFTVVLVFVGLTIALQIFVLWHAHQTISIGLKNAMIASPLIFLSTIMLTEPATMPPLKNQQVIFGTLIAVLYVMAWKIGPLIIYPEVALLIGNAYAFLISPKLKVRLRLQQIQKISDRVYNYVFLADQKFAFLPGQYMEWTLAGVPFDSRGNRRTFTIASSPTEKNVQIGVKYYNPSSAYKYKLSQLKPGDSIYASQLAGNFTLNLSQPQKLAFIAGGIGITPFRSMVKYLTDKQIRGDIILIYIVSRPGELAYKNEFLAARNLGVKLLPVLSRADIAVNGMLSSSLDKSLIIKLIPDYGSRLFYISGPDAMVTSTKKILHSLNVNKIKTDHFTGY